MKAKGFTIVELIVIIAVIGVLAGIVAVAWPNYLKSTNDNERRSDLEQLATALNVYKVQKNSIMYTGSGCGVNGNGNGWVGVGGTAAYPKSIVTCLQEIGALPGEPFVDPSGCTYDSGGTCSNPVRAYMKRTCAVDGETKTFLMASLETEAPATATEIDTLCDSVSSGTNWGTNYGMNYYVEVD